MLKLYRKSELIFSIILIIVYVVGASVCDAFSDKLGFSKALTLPFFIIFSIIILLFLSKQKLFKEYGLCKTELPLKKLLYFIPLVLLCFLNVISGFSITKTVPVIILEVLSMLFVGFLEEIIFRGFLFKSMAKDNLKTAVVVSSLTFGIGHIINLLNGAEIVSTLCQIVGAVGFGFMCVMIFIKSKSLLPCIITHSVFNMFSVFTPETEILTTIIVSAIIFIITVGYGVYLHLNNRNNVFFQE
ncbi:MAG: CPBP family intramembrane metalloprotease [Clostridia bacterium]|nr:CPBP family intramembrane metalloprotease [Clostridia bacterium]